MAADIGSGYVDSRVENILTEQTEYLPSHMIRAQHDEIRMNELQQIKTQNANS